MARLDPLFGGKNRISGKLVPLDRRHAERLANEQLERIEQEALYFLKMGYRKDELHLITHDGLPPAVYPESVLPKP